MRCNLRSAKLFLCGCDNNSTETSINHFQCQAAYEKGKAESKVIIANLQAELDEVKELIEWAYKIGVSLDVPVNDSAFAALRISDYMCVFGRTPLEALRSLKQKVEK